MKMKLRGKLLAAPLATVVVLTVAGAHSWTLQSSAAKERAALVEDIEGYKTLGQSNAQLGALQARVYRTLALLESLKPEEVKAFVASSKLELDGLSRTLTALAEVPGTDAQAREQIQALLPMVATYKDRVIKAIDLSSVDADMGVGAMKAAEQTYGTLGKAVGAVVARTEAAYHEREEVAQKQAAWRTALFGMLALLATIGVLVASLVMQRRLVRDLSRAVAVSREVASGNLTAEAHSDRSDEIGDLIRRRRRLRPATPTCHTAPSRRRPTCSSRPARSSS
jgi:HAMP domain-containing protein